MFDDKVILITGGTGFLGKRYIAKILENYSPKKIIVYSRDEAKQFQMSQVFFDERMRYFVGDVRDYDRLVDATEGVDFIIHASSMKQFLSSEYNPFECVKTNVLGSQNVIRAAIKCRVKKVIALSSDKLNKIENINEATRLTSEKLFVASNNIVGSHKTRFSVVRHHSLSGTDSDLMAFFEQHGMKFGEDGDNHYLSLIDQGIRFTLKNFERMQGGEVFVPKLESSIGKAQAYGNLEVYQNSGSDIFSEIDANRVLEFEDHYVICPTVQFANKSDFTENLLGEKGQYISYGRQSISQKDIDSVVEVLKSDFLTQGPKVPLFEQTVAEYCGAEYGVAVNSATSALHIACLALGLGEGDILWTSPNSFVASANCGLYCGAKVDFVDIDPQTYNLSADRLEDKLIKAKADNQLPKIVIPVHFAGQSCDMARIHQLSQEYGFRIIEDASHAIGGKYLDKPVGGCQYSDITVFSFHPVKIITTAEGGLATTNQPGLAEKMHLLRSHGVTRDPSLMVHPSEGGWYYEQIGLGFNYRMTELQAALGVSQMERLDEFVFQRHQLQQRYDELLDELPVVTPYQSADAYSALHLYPIQVKLGQVNKSHKQIFEELRSKGIGVNLHYIPIHTQPYYQNMGFRRGDFPNAEKYYTQAISIPIFQGLTFDVQDIVIASLFEVLKGE